MELKLVKLACLESKLPLLHQLMPPTPVPPVSSGVAWRSPVLPHLCGTCHNAAEGVQGGASSSDGARLRYAISQHFEIHQLEFIH